MDNDYKKVILDLHARKEDRIQAAFHLENIVDEASIQAMGQALLTDPSEIVRHECAFSLGETAAPDLAAPYLMHAIQHDQSSIVRHESLLALGTLGDSTFIPFIERFLHDHDALVVESAEIALEWPR